MEQRGDSFSESLLEREYVHVQRVYYPINISFTFIDSSTISKAKHRVIKLSPAIERLVQLKMNSPEDNLKVYRRAPFVSAILLVASFLISSFLPCYYMMVAAQTDVPTGFALVTYWIFWTSLLFAVAMLCWNYYDMKEKGRQRRSARLMDEYRVHPSHLKPIFLESLVLYTYLTILLYTSGHIENVLICHVQIITLAFSFCFKIGRNITFTRNMMIAFAVVAAGMFFGVLYFHTLKDDYNAWKGFLAIAGAFLGGFFWLKNIDGGGETNLFVKLLVMNLLNILTSFVLALFFCGITGLFSFFFAHFWTLLVFVALLLLAFNLKSQVITLYEDLIPTVLYIFEPLCLYFYWEVFVRLGQSEVEGRQPLAEFVSFFFTRFLVVLALIVAPQVWMMIEMKRNELNFEGGKIGMKNVERDQMKIEHWKLIKRLNLDRA